MGGVISRNDLRNVNILESSIHNLDANYKIIIQHNMNINSIKFITYV